MANTNPTMNYRSRRRQQRQARRLAVLTADLEAAETDIERLAISYDFLRGAIRRCASPERGAAAVNEMTETMRRIGAELLG